MTIDFIKKVYSYYFDGIEKQIVNEWTHPQLFDNSSPFDKIQWEIININKIIRNRYNNFFREIIKWFLKENNIKQINNDLSDFTFIDKNDIVYFVLVEQKYNINHIDDQIDDDGLYYSFEQGYQELLAKYDKNQIISILWFLDDMNVDIHTKYLTKLNYLKENRLIHKYKIYYQNQLFNELGLTKQWIEFFNLILEHNRYINNNDLIWKPLNMYITTDSSARKYIRDEWKQIKLKLGYK